MPDLLESLAENSIQQRAGGNGDAAAGTIGYSLLRWFAPSGETVPPWWSPDRDRRLRQMSKASDHYSGAQNTIVTKIAAIPFRVEPRDPSVKAHRRQAEDYTIRLYEGSEYGEGYDAWINRILSDWSNQDNGFFSEVIGDGKKDGPIEGPALGLAALDASRCQRTGDPQFPVVYRDTDGRAYKLHRTRVIYRASSPSNAAEMNGVGFCPLSRAVNNVQHLVDIATYEQEKLGSRPKRAILLLGGGLQTTDLQSAMRLTGDTIDGQGLARYSKMVAMGSADIADPSIELIDLMSVPDGFDKQTSTTLGVYAIALAWGIPPRWIWPATATGATKADAMFSHMAGQGSGVGSILTMLTILLGGSPQGARHMIGKFLPPHLKLVYDFQDDEQDRAVAEIKEKRAKQRETDLNTGVIDVRTAREQMLSSGDVTDQQFARMELEDGRLPDGGDVLQLFSSTEDAFIRLLDLDVDEPLAIDVHDPADMLIAIDVAALNAQDELANATSAKAQARAEQSLSALGKLKDMYVDILTQELQAEVEAEIEAEGGQPEQAEQEQEQTEGEEEAEDQESPDEQEEKGFNYGAKVGEVIRGRLVRGAGGKFASEGQIRSGILSKLLDRLRNRRGDRLGAAEQKRLENRGTVSEKLGDSLPGGVATLDGLSSIRSGDAPDNSDALIGRGLAERNADGSVSMTSRGRSLLGAANSGDVDRARTALKPKPAKGGRAKKPKKTAAQRKLEREQAKLEEQASNRAAVAEQLPDDLPTADFDALNVFEAGGDLDPIIAQSLADNGLVEFDQDGTPRLTTSGRQVSRASARGDARGTLDALSRGRDRVQAAQDRADANRAKAEEADARAGELDAEADEADAELDAFESETEAQADGLERQLEDAQAAGDVDPAEVERITARVEALRASIERRRARVDRLRERADEQRTRAEEMRARAGSNTKEGDVLRVAALNYANGAISAKALTDFAVLEQEKNGRS